jgi:hypothetical protein
MSKPRHGGVRHATAAALLVMGVIFAAQRVAANPDVEGHAMLDPEGRYTSLYDPDDVEEIVGQVLRIERVVEGVIPRRGIAEGIQLVVVTHAGIVCAYVGPLWYVAAQPIAIAPGDRVAVRGSPALVDGVPVIVAAHVRTATATLVLRRADGTPIWSATRYRDRR